MSEVKQVKVDNWGIYFLQRLKHFFNRTDFCDLTLQFQDNAQLKVHRLVLSACTEYFEVLERTCEMYEDCLVMPDDLQADVVVPIVNFMYTGQLEFRMDLLEKLHQTSQIMQMPVLTKLLDAHRYTPLKPTQCYPPKHKALDAVPSTSNKRSYSKAFEKVTGYNKEKKLYIPAVNREESFSEALFSQTESKLPNKKSNSKDPRPTRYELPEELDTDNVFDNSFCNISYTSTPLMVHPETVKRYSSKRNTLLGEASCSKMFSDSMDNVECKKITSDNIFDDTEFESDAFQPSYYTVKNNSTKNANQLFDQILDQNTPTKVTIDTKNSKGAPNLDHAKIISEVLKKYSHILKGSKNIKLKILNNPDKTVKKQRTQFDAKNSVKEEMPDYTYETNFLDSKQVAKLIAMGAENIQGPWICLMCGTPGKALNFSTYYKFRRHLVEVHKEKPIANMCEHCGHKALKRNYLLHHLYSKHNIQPPPQYNFPKCNLCDYIALSEGLLTKHKLTHSLNFCCNVCSAQFASSRLLLMHIQNTGHKYSADRKNNLQCIYCLKLFLRENSLFKHLNKYHKVEAKIDGVIEDSDEEINAKEDNIKIKNDNKYEIKLESSSNVKSEYEEMDIQYQIQSDGNIHIISTKKQKPPSKQKILNSGFATKMSPVKSKTTEDAVTDHNEYLNQTSLTTLNDDIDEDEIVTIDNKEYIVRNNQLIPKTKQADIVEYVVPEIIESNHSLQTEIPTTSMELTNVHSSNILDDIQQSGMIVNKANSLNQPIQFVVSNEEEYKALMSANHPIIFDNSDNSKTLTVLTTPHGATLDTATINLDNTQTNDMMIIQEEFPLNVSENVTTDNSNIVVVYSHPVTNQSNQYQLISTQGIESQFVPSSAILTQNYETVTTSAPVVNTQVISTEEVWENEVPQTASNQELQVSTESEVETCSNPEIQIASQANVNQENVSELPEIHLVPNQQKSIITKVSKTDNDSNKSSETPIDGESSEHKIGENDSETLSMSTNVDTTSMQPLVSETSDNEVSQNFRDIGNHTVVTVNVNNTNNKSINDNDPGMLISLQSSDMIAYQEEVAVDQSVCSTTPKSTLTKDKEHIEVSAEKVKQSSIDSIVHQQLTNGTIQQIQTLTSEWSEDESENQHQVSNKEKQPINSEPLVIDSQPEIEESIENIQQEVEKQNAAVTVEKENQENHDQEINVPGQTMANQNQLSTNITPTELVNNSAHDKLSSLLNDWEDNDSQEVGSSKVDMDLPTTVVENPEDSEVPQKQVENIIENVSNPNENIKKLVSDWDDDEEENKD